jgi:hypothetical protein
VHFIATLSDFFLLHPAGLTLTDHTFSVPLDYADESKGSLDVYVREVVAYSRSKQQLPYLLFLQGELALLLHEGGSLTSQRWLEAMLNMP